MRYTSSMRHSPLRHNLARLRLFLSLGQKELAEVAGCSHDTIRSVELGRLKLSEGLARKISAATGVHFRWLIQNDLNAPIIDPRGHTYTESIYEAAQAAKQMGDAWMEMVGPDYAASFYGQIRAIISSAAKPKRDLAEVAVWKIAKFLEDCRREFGHDKKLIAEPEQFGLRPDASPYLKHRQVLAGIALFRAYDAERERVIREALKPTKKDRKPARRA